MKDASSYVREVKDVFGDQPEKYGMFLEIMKDFNAQRIDRARVIAKAKELFQGRKRLIHGFNTFLPEGCEIAPDEPPVRKKAVSYEEAIGFINKTKERFRDEKHVYESFEYLLSLYRRGKEICSVYNEVAVLFAGHPDLFEGFKRFLPENFVHPDELSTTTTLTSRGLEMVCYGRSQGRREGDARGKAGRRLTMKDALSYVREVKDVFRDQQEKYHMFLEIMKDFKTRRIDRARVVARAKELFQGHKRLIHGFNTFLPEGCKIALHKPPIRKKPVSYEEGIGFIHKIKERFRNEEHVYESFENILHLYLRGKEINAVYSEVAGLFAGHPDLLKVFERLLPEDFEHQDELSPTTTTPTSRRLQMIGWPILKPRMKLYKDCADLDHDEDMMRKVHKNDTNANGSNELRTIT
ncbi:paired amphipathic helix protein Sin3-like 1 [Rhodamnia argentea]|uniref:Paired amphipathic helix protein Sin3-like 1 n=1 Tax=Rhodamnia argentea TaxID=178133 RepID=A0ABM3HSV7_9MYRT|nr:paired amphipathic helix protein Sin3-like 1 [Rhodamnia argentea]